MTAQASIKPQRPAIREDQPIPTWFGVGGRARAYAEPECEAQLARLLCDHPDLVVLGDGANLIVGDEGVNRLVVRLAGGFRRVDIEPSAVASAPPRDRAAALVRAGAAALLPRLLTMLAREGLAGLEGLAGIPATVGGAAVMNAGGARGSIGDAVHSIDVMTRAGERRTIRAADLAFAYRRTSDSAGPTPTPLARHIVTAVTLRLTPDDPAAVRARLKDAMAAKKRSQPLGEHSAGCCFRNWPIPKDLGPARLGPLSDLIDALGLRPGDHVPAGLLLDRAGCKGMRVGSATVSRLHANFITVDPQRGTARDVIELLDAAAARVRDRFGLSLEREVVVWA